MTSHTNAALDAGFPSGTRKAKAPRGEWRAPVAMIALCALPLLAGAVRLATLAVGAEVTPENARFFGAPLPVVLHVTGAAVFIVLGAFQFVPSLRRTRPTWHRRAGRLLVPSGLVTALSALWMTQFYQLPAHDGLLLYGFRIFFGSLMAVSLLLGFVAVRRRQFPRHRAWMIRAYALGLGAGTQVLTLLVGEIVLGPSGALAREWLMGAAWMINLALAEWIIRRRRSPALHPTSTGRQDRSAPAQPAPGGTA
jgi:uncharacterized membrane protein